MLIIFVKNGAMTFGMLYIVHCLDVIDHALGGGRTVMKRRGYIDLVALLDVAVVRGAMQQTRGATSKASSVP